MDAPRYELLALRGSEELGRWSLAPGRFTVGRSPECSILLEAEGVADEHAQLSIGDNGSITLEVGPAGASVEGSSVTGAVRILPDQYIDLGGISLVLEAGGSAQAAVSLAEEEPDELPAEFRRPDRYEIGQEIAKGGMGAILQARQSTIRRAVAMKVILGRAEEDPWQRLRFIEEAQITGQLEHPNIVPVHDAGLDAEGRVYYTMKLVKGITLKKVLELLKKEEPAAVAKYSLLTLLTIYQKVCDAIAFAHSKGVIHRDLKPENIMIGSYGEVLVMDWGLAKLFRRRTPGEPSQPAAPAEEVASSRLDQGEDFATMAGSIMGTPAYMAPEQARGELDRLDPRTDIFALGVILYEVLTLSRPFAGKNGDEIIKSICSGGRPALPTTFHPKGDKLTSRPRLLHLNQSTVPESLSAVAMRALAHRPEDRYQKVAALQSDLTAYQNGFATSAERAGAWKQVKLLIKRNKAAALGTAAVLVVGATLGTQALFEARRAERGERLAQNQAARAERGEAAAKATLTDLRHTAPIFYQQAKVVYSEGKFDDAIEKIGYAIQLDETNPEYHLFRANIRESAQQLAEAAEGYRRVLQLRPADAAAQTNLSLCEKLLEEAGGSALGRPQQTQLLKALRDQKRFVETAPLAALIDPDLKTASLAIRARLHEFSKGAGWDGYSIVPLPDGTFRVDLKRYAPGDYSVLKGQPVSVLLLPSGIADLGNLTGLPLKELFLPACKASDLSPLRGMPLEILDLQLSALVSNLEPLRGMKLRELNLQGTKVSDLTPLGGMPLTRLVCQDCKFLSDLSPLRGAPLQTFILRQSLVTDLSPLAGAPLKELRISENKISDLTALSQCVDLEILDLCKTLVDDLTPLGKFRLQFLDCSETKITSIAPLQGQPVRYLNLRQTAVTNLSPLADSTTLEELLLPENATDLSMLRKLPRLRAISTRVIDLYGRRPAQTAEEFWKEYDARAKSAGK